MNIIYISEISQILDYHISELWTGGRDAMAASQFVWDFTGNVLDKNINQFSAILSYQTCVDWHASTNTNGHFDSDPCYNTYGVICEINSG